VRPPCRLNSGLELPQPLVRCTKAFGLFEVGRQIWRLSNPRVLVFYLCSKGMECPRNRRKADDSFASSGAALSAAKEDQHGVWTFH
jgi:hypothetical protein